MKLAARFDAMGQAKHRGLTRRIGIRAVWTDVASSRSSI
jgi:protein gp37